MVIIVPAVKMSWIRTPRLFQRCSSSSFVHSNNHNRLLAISNKSAGNTRHKLSLPSTSKKFRRENQQQYQILSSSYSTFRHSKNSSSNSSTEKSKSSKSSKSSLSSIKNKHYDVAIVGGGAVGSTLARMLSEKVPSLNIALLDARTPRSVEDTLNKTATTPNARAYAISPNNLNLFGHTILERLNDSGRISFYDKMQIWESDGPATLHFNHNDIPQSLSSTSASSSDHGKNGNNNDLTKNILGAVVEDEPLVSCVWEELRQTSNIDLISPATVKTILQPSCSSSSLRTNPKNNNTGTAQSSSSSSSSSATSIELTYQQNHQNDNNNKTTDSSDTSTITTNLLVAADGANSQIRRDVGTFPTVAIAYGRTAVTFTVTLERGMDRTAFQRFHTDGPIALLPIWNDPQLELELEHEHRHNDPNHTNPESTNYANVVWSTTPEQAKILRGLPHSELLQRLDAQLQSGPTRTPDLVPPDIRDALPAPLARAVYGMEMLAQSVNAGISMSGWTERGCVFRVPPRVKGIVGGVFSFDLNLMHAERYIGERVVLVGDAAHTIHPMAGQGLNLGMADAQCLVRNIQQTVESGMGIQSTAGLQYALQQYESERQREVLATMGGIQALHGAFSTGFAPAVYIRSLGMNVLNSVGPVRRYLAAVAVGANQIIN